jgi:hypothetical protein
MPSALGGRYDIGVSPHDFVVVGVCFLSVSRAKWWHMRYGDVDTPSMWSPFPFSIIIAVKLSMLVALAKVDENSAATCSGRIVGWRCYAGLPTHSHHGGIA